MSKTYSVEIVSDGGCQPNPGVMYGSFAITRGGHPVSNESRFMLGDGTNNRAEILALHRGVKKLIKVMEDEEFNPNEFNLTVTTDSKLLVGWTNLKAGFNNQDLQKLFLSMYSDLKKFKSFKAVWTPRENIEKQFGH